MQVVVMLISTAEVTHEGWQVQWIAAENGLSNLFEELGVIAASEQLPYPSFVDQVRLRI